MLFGQFEEPRPKISIIIPYGGRDRHRKKALRWLLRYWSHEIPDAEIILGFSRHRPFIKTEAFNNAVRRSHGRILVLLDADAYIDGRQIVKAADKILDELKRGHHLWYIPYRRLYRLTQYCTKAILHSDPANPLRMTDPPSDECAAIDKGQCAYGRRYAAMAIVIPRQAFDLLGCFDQRFCGWGGEDASILRALDTLWGKHKSINGAIYHLWHPAIGNTYRDRKWRGQTKHNPNDKLAQQYHRATRLPLKMRELVDAGVKASEKGLVKRMFESFLVPARKRS
jgi:predicted glycosyltransferase involved in capsule biosynthesis